MRILLQITLILIGLLVLSGIFLSRRCKAQESNLPEQIHCTVELNNKIRCIREDGVTATLRIGRRHPWFKFLQEAQPQVSTLQLEVFPDKVCLVRVDMLYGHTQGPGNRPYPCLKRPRREIKKR